MAAGFRGLLGLFGIGSTPPRYDFDEEEIQLTFNFKRTIPSSLSVALRSDQQLTIRRELANDVGLALQKSLTMER
jgi:hypothetical protein